MRENSGLLSGRVGGIVLRFCIQFAFTSCPYFCTVLFVSCVEFFLPKSPSKLSPKVLVAYFFWCVCTTFFLYCTFCELCGIFFAQAPTKTALHRAWYSMHTKSKIWGESARTLYIGAWYRLTKSKIWSQRIYLPTVRLGTICYLFDRKKVFYSESVWTP